MDRVESVLDIAINESGDLSTADAAEEKTREEIQKLGKELLHQWTEEKKQQHASKLESSKNHRKYRKKNSTGKASTV